jgi:hypothetical protein
VQILKEVVVNFNIVGDATYASGWQREYYDEEGKQLQEKADKGALDKIFSKIDARVKTPLAFALIAPLGWPGERCWESYNPKNMADHGWMPVAWKESTHLDKTWVQLYMRELPQHPWIEKAPEFKTHSHSVGYTGVIPGNLPYLGCSSFFLSFDKPKEEIDFPKITKFYRPGGNYEKGKLKMSDVFTFVRVARPMKEGELGKLKDMDFEQIAQTPYSRYLVRGKMGVGTVEKCEY